MASNIAFYPRTSLGLSQVETSDCMANASEGFNALHLSSHEDHVVLKIDICKTLTPYSGKHYLKDDVVLWIL